MSNHNVVHFELSSHNIDAMKKFYGDALDWTFTDYPDMNYTVFATGEGGVGGGFSPVNDQNPAGTVLLYLHTDNLENSRGKIRAAGGSIVMESLEITGVGTMAIFIDPSGNTLALLEPVANMD